MNKYPHVTAAFYGATWAITLDKWAEIRALLELRSAGHEIDPDQVRAIVGAARPGEPRVADAIGVLPVPGTIVPRGHMLAQSSGAVSAEMLTRSLRQMMADPAIKGILLDVDSPGGVTDGVDEFASELHRAREKKPVYAVANGLAASAAYWIASQAERLFVTPSGMVGSVGVFMQHVDVSKALEMEGVKPTLVSAGKYKVDGSPYAELTPTARAHMQEIVDDAYGTFVKAVARGRGVSADAVRGGFGEGRAVVARQAVREGMADEVGTFDRALNALAYRVRQGAPVGKVGQAARLHVSGDDILVVDEPAGETLLYVNGREVTFEELNAAEAAKAAEHAEDAPEPAGLSAVEQAEVERTRRRLRLAAR